MKPEFFPKYLALTNEKFHLRTAHSKLNGFWIHELGGLNAVTHLWEYESLEQRSDIRDALAADHGWISEYVVKLLPMLGEQANSIVYEPDWSNTMKFNNHKGPFMMEKFCLAGEAKDCEDVIRTLVEEKINDADLINVLITDIGPTSEVCIIWRADNFSRFTSWKRKKSEMVRSRETIVMKGASWCPTSNP